MSWEPQRDEYDESWVGGNWKPSWKKVTTWTLSWCWLRVVFKLTFTKLHTSSCSQSHCHSLQQVCTLHAYSLPFSLSWPVLGSSPSSEYMSLLAFFLCPDKPLWVCSLAHERPSLSWFLSITLTFPSPQGPQLVPLARLHPPEGGCFHLVALFPYLNVSLFGLQRVSTPYSMFFFHVLICPPLLVVPSSSLSRGCTLSMSWQFPPMYP